MLRIFAEKISSKSRLKENNMTAEKLQRANEIQDDISNFKQIRLISLVDGSVKVVTNNVNGAYLNKRVSEDVKNALEDILSKYQKELESL